MEQETNFYFKEINSIPLLSVDEERKLAALAKKGDKKAFDRLVTSNLRFVLKVAAKYRNCGLEFEDLVSEGNAGLVKAAAKFDLSKNVRFVTYAVWWIRESIVSAIAETGSFVRFPRNRQNEARSEEWQVSSLDKIVDLENGSCLGDFIGDTKSLSPEEAFEQKESLEFLDSILRDLTKKERDVITLRYGLKEDEPLNYREISSRLSYSKEGICQIEARARNKIYNACRKNAA